MLVALLSLVTYHGLTVTSGIATWLWDWSADPGSALAAGCTPAIDHQRRFGRDKVGVREYQGQLVTVIAVNGGEDDPASRHRHRSSRPTLLVQAVASGLRQFDIHLDDIDIVSVKVRRAGMPPSCPSSTTGAPRNGRWRTISPPPTCAGPGWCCG
ncbi:type VII secretion protein EccE [Mycobacterium intracellulare]|nr:type VII secretion protein EccE [Mycobacterium intracellulare]